MMKTTRNAYKFTNRTTALSFRYDRCTQPMRVILGDDDMFWVVTPADAERLLHAGYEIAD
jgi:hypothetical protein